MAGKTGSAASIVGVLRKNGGPVLIEALVNFILPFVIYSYAEAPLGEVRALLASSMPPIVWSVIEFARHRRIDALSILVMSGIALSLLAMLGGGGVRFLQLREKLVTGLIGVAFVGSILIGRPLMYELARASMRRTSENDAQQFEALKAEDDFRRTMAVMTLVWGTGLLVDAGLSVLMVFALNIRDYLIFNPILSYSIVGVLSLWTFLYGQRGEKPASASTKSVVDTPSDTAED